MHSDIPLINFETERLILRGLNPLKYDEMMRSDPDQRRKYFGFRNDALEDFEIQKWQAGLTGWNRSFYHFFLLERESKKVLGAMGFHTWYTRHHRAEIGYGIFDEADRQHGFLREAFPTLIRFGFETMQLVRMEATLSPENMASLKVLERAGFQQEGIMRGHFRLDGVNRDSLLMSLLVSDWHQDSAKTS
ncbi:MAG: GNAT family N-acetyltransferase [Chitinophagaceae bacterium]|nr:GNAT family N-acetyltransferase [Chitinophagaceae bacterium]